MRFLIAARWFSCVVAATLAPSAAADSAEPFYKEPALFSTRPSDTASMTTVDRFGPVGIGIELHQPAFVMKIKNVEEGSPAAATGKLSKGQVIESINGQKLADIDPRIQLGTILAEAEATDGQVRLLVRDDKPGATASEVVVSIPVLGRYSKTWPLDCPKSEKIVRGFADYLVQLKADQGFGSIGMLFLLSTGEDKDLAHVRAWVHGLAEKPAPTYAWHLGYGGIPLCEYYLRTGDKAAIPVIEKWAESAKKGEYLDAWAGRGGVTKVSYGNGHLNAGGTAVVTFLLLAKECGAKVDESLLHRTLVHFFRFAGRGVNPYGDDRPENSFVDNGKNGNLAFAMAAAASLTPDGEKSTYAGARDIAAMSSFYTTTFMLHGHTGGGIGEIWRSAAMGLLHDKKPKQYREFMDARQWHYDLSRRFNGSFGILGGAGYDKEEWGAGYALTYTIPRKTLRVTGAPSPYAKPYQLPARPWGTAADDVFESLEPAAYADGTKQDVSNETLARDSSKPLIVRLNAEAPVSDDEVRRLIHHPEPLIRHMASNHCAGLTFDYMFPKPGPAVRHELLAEFRRSADARVRNAGFRGTAKAFDPEAPWATQAIADAAAVLADDKESWWVKDAALALMACGTPDMVAPHVDLIVPYLSHQEQWLQNGALMALVPVVTDARCYEKVLPPVGKLLKTCQRWSTTAGPVRLMREKLVDATPAVRDLAAKTLETAYESYGGVKTWVGGQNISGVYDSHLELLAATLADVPGGYDILFDAAKKRYPNEPLPYAQIFLDADPEKLSPRLRALISPMIRDQLVYKFIAENRPKLLMEAAVTGKPSPFTEGAIDQLVGLFQKADIHDYDWHVYGPDLKEATWDYFTFDPPEKQAPDLSPWRYRPVTLPKGMEEWFEPSFSPSAAGWLKGKGPFGQFGGQVLTKESIGSHPDAHRYAPMRTLWDKEVFLLRGTFEFPKPKPGHLYRILVGTGENVGNDGGFAIYVNGRQLIEAKEGIGRRAGGNPRGAIIPPAVLDEFAKGPVTLAFVSFLKTGPRAIVTMPPVWQGMFNPSVEERKIPPLDEAAMRKAATFLPMRSSEWQASLPPPVAQPADGADAAAADSGESTVPPVAWYHYDGSFVANAPVLGTWQIVSVVPSIDAFEPAKRVDQNKAPLRKIALLDNGKTDSPDFLWSGDRLLNLNRREALRMQTLSKDGKDYLCVEAGGFNEKNPPGWKTAWAIFARP